MATEQGLAVTNSADPRNNFPSELERSYQVFVIHGENAKKKIQKMREVKAN